MYIHHPAQKFGHCLAARLAASACSVYPPVSIYLFLSSPRLFLFALSRSQFRRSTLPDGKTRAPGRPRASYENPISVTSELKAIGRYRGITCVTTECYTRKLLLSASVPEWSSFEIDVGGGGGARARTLFIQFPLLMRRTFLG